jgi:hypothetical protein
MNTDPERKLGMNRTGIDLSPRYSKQMIARTEELTLPRCPEGDAEAIGENRASYMAEAMGVGSLPPPATVKGLFKTGMQAATGRDPKILLDKLGERLAFERTGTRLYEALISKFKAEQAQAGAVASLERLVEIHDEELAHFQMVADAVRALGADPTAVTPAADIAGVASMGLVQALGDPRIGFVQSLDAILTAELADNDAWGLLIQLVANAGLDDLAEQFEAAYTAERSHLATIRAWVEAFSLGERKAA